MSREDFEMQRAYGRSALSFVKGLGLAVTGVAAVLVALKSPDGGAVPGGWLYRNLGPEGSKRALAALGIVIVMAGLAWALAALRSMVAARSALQRLRGR